MLKREAEGIRDSMELSEGPDARSLEGQRLCDALEKFAESRRRAMRRLSISVSAFAVLAAAVGLPLQALSRAALHQDGSLGEHRFLFVLLAVTGVAAMAGMTASLVRMLVTARNREARSAVERLEELKWLPASATLLRLLRVDDARVRRSAEAALLDLVPYWDQELFESLSAHARYQIRCSLNMLTRPVRSGSAADSQESRRRPLTSGGPVYPIGPPLQAALCSRLSWFGDGEDLKCLRAVARGIALTEGQRSVKRAAQAGIPFLDARLAEMSSGNTLVRAASAPTASSAELLRVVTGTESDAEIELLRAVDRESA